MEKIITNNNNIAVSTFEYAKVYLAKAKEQNKIDEIIYGYFYASNQPHDLALNLKYNDSAITVAKKVRIKKLSFLYWSRGILFYNKKQLKKALDCFLLAKKYNANTYNPDIEDRINYGIGTIKSSQGNYKEAISIYEKCAENALKYKFSNYLLYIVALSELYNRVDKIEISEKLIDNGLSKCKNDADGNYYIPYFISTRGKNHFKRKEYSKAILHLKSQLESIQKKNDYSNYAENCFYIGESYRNLNKINIAVPFYKKVDSIFVKDKDIYPIPIKAYQHLIDYYKSKNEYEQVVYYSDQFIKADKILDENYKYITNKIHKTYDIDKVISSKQLVISSLKKRNLLSKSAIAILIVVILLFGFIYYINIKNKKAEIIKQKKLFEEYKIEREKKILAKVSDKEINKKTANSIDKNVVNQILDYLNVFEREKMYLKKEYTLDTLATECKTNSSYLSKVLNEIKGIAFTQYINNLRIEYIIEKLETEKIYLAYTIQALSEFAGFNSVQTFTRAFKELTKVTPSYYIKELKNK